MWDLTTSRYSAASRNEVKLAVGWHCSSLWSKKAMPWSIVPSLEGRLGFSEKKSDFFLSSNPMWWIDASAKSPKVLVNGANFIILSGSTAAASLIGFVLSVVFDFSTLAAASDLLSVTHFFDHSLPAKCNHCVRIFYNPNDAWCAENKKTLKLNIRCFP